MKNQVFKFFKATKAHGDALGLRGDEGRGKLR